jgi:hypothetical protein
MCHWVQHTTKWQIKKWQTMKRHTFEVAYYEVAPYEMAHYEVARVYACSCFWHLTCVCAAEAVKYFALHVTTSTSTRLCKCATTKSFMPARQSRTSSLSWSTHVLNHHMHGLQGWSCSGVHSSKVEQLLMTRNACKLQLHESNLSALIRTSIWRTAPADTEDLTGRLHCLDVSFGDCIVPLRRYWE